MPTKRRESYTLQIVFTYSVPFEPHIILCMSREGLGVTKGAALLKRTDHFPPMFLFLPVFLPMCLCNYLYMRLDLLLDLKVPGVGTTFMFILFS